MNNIQSLLSQFSDDSNSLEIQLESTAKHLRSYLKVIKDHIPELQRVLKSENHNYKSMETIELTTPIKQLMELFETLEESDIQTIEELSTISKRWESKWSENENKQEQAW